VRGWVVGRMNGRRQPPTDAAKWNYLGHVLHARPQRHRRESPAVHPSQHRSVLATPPTPGNAPQPVQHAVYTRRTHRMSVPFSDAVATRDPVLLSAMHASAASCAAISVVLRWSYSSSRT